MNIRTLKEMAQVMLRETVPGTQLLHADDTGTMSNTADENMLVPYQ